MKFRPLRIVAAAAAVLSCAQAAHAASTTYEYRKISKGLVASTVTGTPVTSPTLPPALTKLASLSSTSVVFDAQPLGGSQTKSILISNTGTDVLTLGTPQVSGSAFTAESSCQSTLAAGQSCAVSVTFNAATTAAQSGLMALTSDATNGALEVSLSGSTQSLSWNSFSANGYVAASPLARANFASASTLCGQVINGSTGWRMPTQTEFEALRAEVGYGPGFSAKGWPIGDSGASYDYYWTSTPYSSGHVVRLATSGGSWANNGDSHYPVCIRTEASVKATGSGDFGTMYVGASSSKTFTLTAGPVAVSSLVPTVTGTGYTLSGSTCSSTLAANTSCTVTVSFAAPSVGTAVGELRVTSSAAQAAVAALTATAQSDYSSVTHLLHYDGTNGQTSVADEQGRTYTRVGSASLSSTQSKFGGTSLSIPNTSSWIESTTAFAIGSQDFTIETWVYPTSSTQYQQVLGQQIANNNATWWLGIYNGKPTFASWNAVGWSLDSPTLVTLNAWNHMAVTRQGTTLRMYLNGNLVLTKTATSPSFVSNRISFGSIGPGMSGAFTGYLDDTRISVGYARYTGATYTVPTAPFPNN